MRVRLEHRSINPRGRPGPAPTTRQSAYTDDHLDQPTTAPRYTLRPTSLQAVGGQRCGYRAHCSSTSNLCFHMLVPSLDQIETLTFLDRCRLPNDRRNFVRQPINVHICQLSRARDRARCLSQPCVDLAEHSFSTERGATASRSSSPASVRSWVGKNKHAGLFKNKHSLTKTIKTHFL